MDKKRLMELAGVEQLNEAKVTEEQREAIQLFRQMMSLYDMLGRAEAMAAKAKPAMKKLGYEREATALIRALVKVQEDDMDFMPGLEMMSKGEE